MSDFDIITHEFNDKVVVVCPTYNRRIFLPVLIYQFLYQIYPPELLHMIVLDDSESSNADIFEGTKSRITYIYSNERKCIGAKRNILNDMAKKLGPKYIVCFDDDDYYPPHRIAYGVYALKNSNYLIGGASNIPIYHVKLDEIYLCGTFINKISPYHASNGTLIYDVAYLNKNAYNDNDKFGEEKRFLKMYKNRLLQLPYENVMLCISHSSNTIDKTKFVNNKSSMKIEDIIHDVMLLHFFSTL
jgi:hypothetical protein